MMHKRSGLFAAATLAVMYLMTGCSQPSLKADVDTAPRLTPTSIATPTPKPTPPQAAVDAVKALRKMTGATEMGINFQEYGTRMIDLKADVDEALVQLPDGELKNEIRFALEAYVDAKLAWNDMATDKFLMSGSEPGRSLQRKYSIPGDGDKKYPAMLKPVVLTTIWNEAEKHTDRASKLLE